MNQQVFERLLKYMLCWGLNFIKFMGSYKVLPVYDSQIPYSSVSTSWFIVANNRWSDWKNNQSSNDKRKYLNYSNRLSFKLTWIAINLIFSFPNLIFNGLQKIKSRSLWWSLSFHSCCASNSRQRIFLLAAYQYLKFKHF